MLLGILLGIIAYSGNIYLEKYKNSLTKERFLLENRLTALKELSETHGKLTQETIAFIRTNKEKHDLESYKNLIEEFDKRLTKWKALFSWKLDMNLTAYTWFH